MSEHVSAERLGQLAREQLPEAETESARGHIATCSTCSAALFDVVSQSRSTEATGVVSGPAPLAGDALDPVVALPRGSTIGRYVLLDRLGTGGMGVVYGAFDPELDRKIAIKILQSHRAGSAGQNWLLREAQAMARLSHPNVIAVHDVGVWNERVFVAMDLVEGDTFRTWFGKTDRTWRETTRAMIAAGRGLAAAHAAGIVHRDFKPENILLGKDGRICVLDFGLARATGPDGAVLTEEAAAAPAAAVPPPLPGSPERAVAHEPTAPYEVTPSRLVSSVLTQAGVVMGTLPYMAPEQLQGRGPDIRSDQFAFAVTLHEALYGQRPFLSEVSGNPNRWTLRDPPPGTQVPAWLRRVLIRALALDSGARFGSMDELLSALEADPTLNRRRRWQAGAAAGLLLSAVGITWSVARSRADACTSSSDRVASVWNKDRGEKIRQAFAATGKPFAAASADSVARTLEAYASDWTARRTEACEATRVRREQPESVMALRNACLDRRLEELGSLAGVLETADAAMVLRAPQAVTGLSSLAGCADVVALIGRVQPRDATVAQSAGRLSSQLAQPTALLRAGVFAKGLEGTAPLVEEARKLAHPPLLAEALLLQGELQLESGDLRSAERTLLEAAATAQEARADDLGTSAWERLVQTGLAGAKFDDGFDAARFASATLARLGGRDDLKAVLLATRSRLSAAAGKYADALADATESIRLQQKLYGGEHAATASAVHSAALAHFRRGELEPAEKLFRQALATRERVLGPNHPDVAATAHGLGSVLHSSGKFADARELYLRAVAIREVALGDKHSELASTLNNLAALHAMQRQFAEAQPYAERALGILEAVHGPENSYVAFALNNLGNLHKDQGRAEKALEYHLRALAVREKTLGPEHTEVAMSLNNVADCYRALGRTKEALEKNLRSVAIREKVLPPGHKDLATSLVGATLSYLKLTRSAEAAKAAARAVEIRQAAKVSDLDVADAKALLAQALMQGGKELPRAKTLTDEARAVFETKKDTERIAELDAWLSKRAR